MIGKTISHYRILEKLGGGGMGVVYKAEDSKLKRLVALKLLPPELTRDPDAKERFVQEAQAASSLDHANICTIYEIDETEDGELFICMAYYEGETLKKKVDRGPLKLEEIVRTAIQVAEGLGRVHETGVIHRDIKPANLMITERGELRIVDFGLARLAGGVRITKQGTTIGTVAYMSPEQARGEEIDQRADIWSLGVVLYEMLTGQLPFKGEYGEAIVYSILNEVPEPVTSLRTGVPMELERIVRKALEKDPSRRNQRMEDMLVDLRNTRDRVLARDLAQKPSVKRYRKLLIPVVALLVVAVGLVVGIRIQIGRQPAAVAEENSLAVMYFDNLADPEDPERLGEIVTNLLITDLSESRYVQVVSSQRLYDILKLLGREGTKVIDRDVASQVAGKANTRWMLLGSILQSEPEIILTAQLVEVSTGKAVASQRITGEPGEKIFSLVDKLVVEVKSDLSLPAAAQKEADRPVADVTTHSAEAYRYYLEGDDYRRKWYYAEAEKSYRKALEHDSTLAMAYYQLARVGRERGRGWGRELLNEAMKYSDKVSEKERHYIGFMDAFISMDTDRAIVELEKIVERYPEEKEALENLGMLHQQGGESEEAARYYQRIIEIDPLHKSSYNSLAYLYDEMGDLEKSIWAINKYISLAPGEANPYDSRGELYANNGKMDQAIESYKKALEIKPDFYTSVKMLGHLHRFKREYGKAESYYRKLCSSDDKDVRSTGRTKLALIPMHQGKFVEALKVLDDGITADRMEQTEKGANAEKHWEKATIYLEQKNPELALKEARVASEVYRKAHPHNPLVWRLNDVYFLALGGKFEEAEETARALQEVIAGDPMYMQCHWWVLGEIELAKGNAEAAARYLEKAREAPEVGFEFVTGYMLAQAYLDSGRHGEAVTELEQILSTYSATRLSQSIWSVKVHYFLGLAYEESGWAKKAIEQYEEFLEIWKDADPGIEEVDDARARLARLKGAS